VVDVGGAEAYSEGFAGGGVGGVEGEEESDGICTAGDGDAEAVSGLMLVRSKSSVAEAGMSFHLSRVRARS